jgi:hypothetical protein
MHSEKSAISLSMKIAIPTKGSLVIHSSQELGQADDWFRKLSRRLSQPGFPCYGITSGLLVTCESTNVYNITAGDK